MAYVHHVKEKVCFPDLIKRALERFHKLVREFSDEAYGIAEEERSVVYNHLSYGCVQGGEELVFRKDLALGEKVHYGALSNIGIAYKRDSYHASAMASLGGHLAVYLLELVFELRDLVHYYTAVCLQLFFTGSATGSATSTLSFQVAPHTGKPRENILVSCKLDLGFGISSLGPHRENIQNQRRAVQNGAVKLFFKISHLGAGKLIIEHGQRYLVLGDVFLYLLKLALAHVCAGIRLVYSLQKPLDTFYRSCHGQKLQFVQIFVCLKLRDIRSHRAYQNSFLHKPGASYLFLN